MAMTHRISATLDAKSEAALNRVMKRTGWTKSQVLREAVWAAAESRELATKPAPGCGAAKRVKIKS
jgi:predicted DNA-binding protein